MESAPRLEGKVALVTGGGSRLDEGIGNGRAAAILMAREGARIAVADRSRDAAEATVEMIHKEGGEAFAVAADVTSAEDCKAMVAATVSTWGRLDVLDNNVGVSGPGSVLSAEEQEWDRVMEINVKGMMLASKHAIPAMIGSGGGSIINISSVAALRPSKLTPYATSKGAVISLTRAMAVDHAIEGVRVNCVAPGPVYTPMVYADGMADELRQRRKEATLLKTEGTGWDIGFAVLFLASDEARYITGVVLPVDGGVLLNGPSRR